MANDLSISNFAGSAPRLAPHLVPHGHAVNALDCKLDRGMLDSWREPLLHLDNPKRSRTFYQHDCCWLDFEGCVDIAQGEVGCRRLFATGVEAYPVSITVDVNCNMQVHRLGIPCPTTPPSAMPAALTSRPDKDMESRSYAYRYVNSEGDVGALSPGSQAQQMKDGVNVVVSGWPVPVASWGITKVQIFRTVTGLKTGREQGNTVDTTWMMVGETDVSATAFTDDVINELLLDALDIDEANPPPANLQGLVWVESMNTLAGFVGNRVYFSANNRYHHWPDYIELDDNVCALAESNGIVYAITDGRPYAITGAVDCISAACREAVRLPGEYPLVGCGNRRVATIAAGVVYPSHKGLVLLVGRSAPVVVTWGLYTEEQWQCLEPHTAVITEHTGRLYAFFANGAFTLRTPASGEQGWSNDTHSELSDREVIDAFVSRTGELFILKELGLYHWDRGQDLRPHTWVSGTWIQPVPVHQGAARLVMTHGKEHLKIKVDVQRVVLDRDVPSERVIRLPMWATGTRWEVTLSGTAQVSTVSIAPSMHDLGV